MEQKIYCVLVGDKTVIIEITWLFNRVFVGEVIMEQKVYSILVGYHSVAVCIAFDIFEFKYFILFISAYFTNMLSFTVFINFCRLCFYPFTIYVFCFVIYFFTTVAFMPVMCSVT